MVGITFVDTGTIKSTENGYAISADGQNAKNEIKFNENSSSIQGNIQAKAGGSNNITFIKQGEIKGDITATNQSSFNSILLTGSSSVTGNITASDNGVNNLDFKSGGHISGMLHSEGTSKNHITLKADAIAITFTQASFESADSSKNLISSSFKQAILRGDLLFQGTGGKNEILMSGLGEPPPLQVSTTLKENELPSSVALTLGKLTTKSGTTQINFAQLPTEIPPSTLEANFDLATLDAQSIDTQGGTTDINFNGKKENSTFKIQSSIHTSGGITTINHNNATTAVLSGMIHTSGGLTHFEFKGNDSVFEIIEGNIFTNQTGKTLFSTVGTKLTIKAGDKIQSDHHALTEFNLKGSSTMELSFAGGSNGIDYSNYENSYVLINFEPPSPKLEGSNTHQITGNFENKGVLEVKSDKDLTWKSGGLSNFGTTTFFPFTTLENAKISNGSVVFLASHNKIQTLDFKGGEINLSSKNINSPKSELEAKAFNLLTIGDSLQSPSRNLNPQGGTFVLYTDIKNAIKDKSNPQTVENKNLLGGQEAYEQYGYAYSDRILVEKLAPSNNQFSSTFKLELPTQITVEDLQQIVYDDSKDNPTVTFQEGVEEPQIPNTGGSKTAGNIAIATIKTSSPTNLSNTKITAYSDLDMIEVSLTEKPTKADGSFDANGDYKTIFIDQAQSAGLIQADAAALVSDFMINYDLYIANFDSLNKRLGELRGNPSSQGIWARVFYGSQTNNLNEIGTTNTYTTIQTGYDYAIGLKGANNYIGLAFSYALSTLQTKSNNIKDNFFAGLDNVHSNAIEALFYNSFVGDGVNVSKLSGKNWARGFYNDTIVKASYLFSDFSVIRGINDQHALRTSYQYKTDNLAITFIDEFGYILKMGGKGEWALTPQFAIGVGYLTSSNFKDTLTNAKVRYLLATANQVINIRNRIGTSFSYDFKNFSTHGVNAQIYMGTHYIYDLAYGEDINLKTRLNEEWHKNSLQNDGRVALNIGTNMQIQDFTRIYFDFETSFMGKINTDYQVNIGFRYAFGVNKSYKSFKKKKGKRKVFNPKLRKIQK